MLTDGFIKNYTEVADEGDTEKFMIGKSKLWL